jgi:nickel transport protein
MSSRFVVVATLFFAAPSTVSAHGIGVEARLKGDRVAVEAFFDDDTPAADAEVAVTTENGAVVAEGKADAKGMWSFPAPAPGKYRVTVDAGGGHRAKTTITIPARPAAAQSTTPSEGAAPATDTEVVVSDGPTRAEMTGWQRWLMAVVGVALIGLFTWGVRLATRRKAQREARASRHPVSR